MKNLFQSFTKRGLSLLIALTMCMSFLPVNAFAAEGEPAQETVDIVETQDEAPVSEDINTEVVSAQPENNEDTSSDDSSDSSAVEESKEDDASSELTADEAGTDVTEAPEAADGEPAADENVSEAPEAPENIEPVPEEPAATESTELSDETAPAEESKNQETPDAGEEEKPWDISDTERPDASEDVSADIGTSDDKLNLKDKDWDIFYDEENDVYKVTFTLALELLGKYAETGKQELKDAIDKLEKPVMGDAGEKPTISNIGEAPVEPEKPVAPDAPTKPEEPKKPVEPGKPENLEENLDVAYQDIVDNVPRDDAGEPDQNFDYAGLIAEKTGLPKDDPFVKDTASHMYDQAMVDWVMSSWDKWEAEGHMYAKHFGDPDTMLYYGCGITVKWPDGPNTGTPVLKNPAPEYKVDKTSPAYQEYTKELEAYDGKVAEYEAKLAEYEKAAAEYEKEHGVDSPEYKAYQAEMEKYQAALDAYNAAKAAAEAEYAQAVAEYEAKQKEIEAKYANDKKAYDQAIAELKAEFDRRVNANVLEPGDVKKFELYFTSDSKHTYVYKDGSFTLATPKWSDFMAGLKNLWDTDPDAYKAQFLMPNGKWLFDPENLDANTGTTGFDGQILPDAYVDNHKYNVTVRCEPVQELLKAVGMDDYDRFNGSWPSYYNRYINEFLDKYEGADYSEKLNAYILDYYNGKCGTSYASVTELVKNNPDAKAELAKTETSGNKWFKVDGKYVI